MAKCSEKEAFQVGVRTGAGIVLFGIALQEFVRQRPWLRNCLKHQGSDYVCIAEGGFGHEGSCELVLIPF